MSQGQVTATIYGHLREGRHDEAIQILEWELQVTADFLLFDQEDQQTGLRLVLAKTSVLLQTSPTSRAALSLLAYALFQAEDFAAAAAL